MTAPLGELDLRQVLDLDRSAVLPRHLAALDECLHANMPADQLEAPDAIVYEVLLVDVLSKESPLVLREKVV